MCTLNVTVSLITHVINTVNEVGVQYTHNTTLPRSPCAKLGLLERNNHRCKKKKKKTESLDKQLINNFPEKITF